MAIDNKSLKILLNILECVLYGRTLEGNFNQADVNELKRLILSNNLACFLLPHLERFKILEPLRPAIKKNALLQLRKNLSLKADLFKIMDLCSQEGVDLVVYKGNPINEEIYGADNLRMSTDIDILVDPAQLPKMQEVLELNNYKIVYPLFKMDAQEKVLFQKVGNEMMYFSPNNNPIDLHFRLFINPFTLSSAETAQQYLIQQTYHGRAFKRYNKVYTFLFLVAHGKKHFWERITWLLDISLLLKQLSADELEELWELAVQWKSQDALLEALSFLNYCFNQEIPNLFKNKINKKHRRLFPYFLKGFQKEPISAWVKLKQRLFFKKDWNYFKYQLSLFPARDMEVIKVPFAKSLLYPILRPFTYLMVAKKEQK